MRKPRSPLIVDPDEKFLSTLRLDPRASQLAPLVAKNGKEAQLQLANADLGIAGVFVNLTTQDPSGISVIRFAHQRRPAVPVYIIYDDNPPLGDDDLRQLPVQKVIPKPLDYSQIMSYVAPASLFFDAGSAIAAKSSDQVDAEISEEDTKFLPIRAEDFLAGTKSFFDVYVRLNSSRYVKILQAGDAFSVERVNSYLEKGVHNFYLRREVQEKYLSYCDKIATALLKNNKVSMEVKVSQTLNQGEETLSFLKSHGLSESNLQYANNFVDNVHTLVQQINPGTNDMFRGFLADIASFEHGVSTAMISSLLVHPLKFESEKAIHLIGLSSLLHDIGLYRQPAVVQEEDETKMTNEQKAQYRLHPSQGAQILKGIHGIDPAVVQAVSQHHERRNKKGFPARVGVGHINRVAEIVGIADEFARLIKKAQASRSVNMLQEMETRVFDGFSHPIVEAFRVAFFSQTRN